MKMKIHYDSPTVKVARVALEEGLAQTGHPVSIGASLVDWEDGGTLGDDPEEGGDIILVY